MILDKHIINVDSSIKNALEALNSFKDFEALTLFIVDGDNKLLGTLTDGDIRRGLVQDIKVEDTVAKVMFTDFRYFKEGEVNLEKFIAFKKSKLKLIPVLDESGVLVKLADISKKKSFLPIDALIMAGGKGTRLRPLTEKTPKPLLEIGGKPIIEYNVDRLNQFGVNNLHISVKYLGEQLEDYFQDGSEKAMKIKYLWEDEPLGTIGIASELKDKLKNDVLLVMNSDLLTNVDFEDMYKEFESSGAKMMLATIPYDVNVPYAVIETEEDKVLSLKEKPTYTYYSNAGIYLMKKEVLELIPAGEHYNATDLLEAVIAEGNKVAHFPILGYWLDIGKPNDFEKAKKDVDHINW